MEKGGGGGAFSFYRVIEHVCVTSIGSSLINVF